MPAQRKDLPKGIFLSLACTIETHQEIGLKELESDPNKVQCLVCQAHVFGALPFQRKGVKKHIESQAHLRAIHAASEAKEEESAIRIKIQRLDTQALEAEAEMFMSSLSGELPIKHSSASQTLVDHDETLREREMWERFEMDGLECSESFRHQEHAQRLFSTFLLIPTYSHFLKADQPSFFYEIVLI